MKGKLYPLETSQFIAYVCDNSAVGIHHAGYNGLASLIPKPTGNNIFVPTYCGLNYETTSISNLKQERDQRFEPRRTSMKVVEANNSQVQLHQAPTDFKGIEAQITFQMEEPYYIHQRVRMTFQKRFSLPMSFRSLWASYMHMPPDRHIYLQMDNSEGALEGWIGVTKEEHSAPEYIARPLPNQEISVAEHLKAMESGPILEKYRKMEKPLTFYYGLYYNDAFIMMFKEPQWVQLAYSPCGGGKEPAWNPAWDYILHQDKVEVGKSYEWNLCLAYKPYLSRQDILEEVRRYHSKSK